MTALGLESTRNICGKLMMDSISPPTICSPLVNGVDAKLVDILRGDTIIGGYREAYG